MGPASDIGGRGVLNFGLKVFPEKLSVKFNPSRFQVIKNYYAVHVVKALTKEV